MLRQQDIVHLRDGRGDCYLGPAQAFDRRFRLTWPHGARQVGDELQAFVTHHDAMAALRRLYSQHCDGGSRTWRMSDWDVVTALRHELSCGRLVMICGRPTVPEIARRGGCLAASLQDLAHLAGATPAAPAGPVSGPVSSWSLEQRIERVLRLTQDKLPGHMRAEFAALISPEAIAITIGIIAVWAASHGTPVGPAVDILLLLIGIVALGWGVFEAASALYDFIAAVVGASSERDLDRAARHLARAVALLGVAAFAALLRKIGRTGQPRGKGGSTSSTKPDAPDPEPPPPVEVGHVPKSSRRSGPETPERKPTPAAGPSRTVPTGKFGGKPRGTPSKIDPRSSPQTQRKIQRENEAAETLAKAGYDIEQNPGVQPNGKYPDYKIEGKIFDNLAPDSDNIEQVRKGISRKVENDQAKRILLNMDDTSVTADNVSNVLARKPKEGLEEVIGIKDGEIYNIFP
ncbi:MAG: hypothetical protein MI785_26510 [Kiloniellales bacterium]|nr:hypothetical protein [Kiloniellales bacterium]